MDCEFVKSTAFPPLMEISIKMTITLGAGISINSIYYTFFIQTPHEQKQNRNKNVFEPQITGKLNKTITKGPDVD